MFLHIMVNQLHEQLTIIISHANMLFYPLYYDIIKLSLTCLNITQVFYLLRGFAENQIFLRILKFKIAFG